MVGFALRGIAATLLWLLARCLARRASASVRRLVDVLAVGSLLVLPVLEASVPTWTLRILPASAPARSPVAPLLQPIPVDASATAIQSIPKAPPRPHAEILAELSPLPVLPLLWAAGALLLLVRLATILGLAMRLIWRCAPADSAMQALLDGASRQVGARRLAALRIAEEGVPLIVPMTAGFLRHVVLLPREASQWPPERLNAAFRHESAHMRQEDWLWLVLSEAVKALYWFNPLAWMLARSLRTNVEEAADDLVIRSGLRPSEYASHLTEVAAAL